MVKLCIKINETENNDITEKQQRRSPFTDKTNKTDKIFKSSGKKKEVNTTTTEDT